MLNDILARLKEKALQLRGMSLPLPSAIPIGRLSAMIRAIRLPDRETALSLISPASVGLLLAGLTTGLALLVTLTAEEAVKAHRDAIPRVTVQVQLETGEPMRGVATGTGAGSAPESSDMPPDASAEGMSMAPGEMAPPPEPAGPVTLAPAPAPGLVRETRDGPLPVIGPDGEQPWQVYARPFPERETRKRIGIIMVDMGAFGAKTNMALDILPPEVTFGFLPFGDRLQSWVDTSRKAGHEAVLMVPMEPEGYPRNDPGPATLLVSKSTENNILRLERHLKKAVGYVGVLSMSGSRFQADIRSLRPILEQVRDRGLLFIDSRVAPGGAAAKEAGDLATPWVVANLFIDPDPSRATVDRQLEMLEEIAGRDGAAIGIGRPYPTTIRRIPGWARLLRDKGFVLAPVSAIAGRQPLPEG